MWFQTVLIGLDVTIGLGGACCGGGGWAGRRAGEGLFAV